MVTDNPIFDKNLKCIEKYNPALKEKLLNVGDLVHKFEIVETQQKEPNMLYDGIPLHSIENAEKQAKEIFAKGDNNRFSRHIIFGIGLGYLFKEACEQSKGVVFLYEPDLEILRVTLEIVDFSKELSQANVFVFSNLAMFKSLYDLSYLQNAVANVLSLPNYRLIYRNQFDSILSRLLTAIKSNVINLNSYKSKIEVSVSYAIRNLSYLLKTTPLSKLKDIYKDKTAIIVSAGPTLDDNIETIKKYQNNAVIFCIGQAFKTLAKNGINPDFVNILETVDCSSHLAGYDLSEINLITDSHTHPNVYNLEVKKNFLLPSDNEPINNFIKYVLNLDDFVYDIHGTVAYAAVESAKIMGCSKIIIVGQDFAYLNNRCYSSGSAYSDIIIETDSKTKKPVIKVKDEENFIKSTVSEPSKLTDAEKKTKIANKLKLIQERLYEVKGITGEMLFTGADYACYIEFFSEFANNNSKLDLINTSMKGANIPGFKNIPLEKAMENSSPIVKIEKFEDYKYDSKMVLEKLTYSKNNLLKTNEYFGNIKQCMYKYEREIKLRHQTTKTAVKYLKELLQFYKKLITRTLNDRLYNTISYAEGIDIDQMIKSKDDFTVKDTEELYELLRIYFVRVENRMSLAIKELESQEKYFKENEDAEKFKK